MKIIRLLIVDVSLAFNHWHFLLKSISEEQKEKALKFKNEKDQARSLISSYLVNSLSDQKLLKKEMGKPYFENGPYFNVSHSGKYVIMGISESEVGVDIEENSDKDMSALVRIFNESEAKMIKEHADFYFLWCAKESLIKCFGGSVSQIKEVPSLPLNGLKTFKGKDYQSQTFLFDKHIISITSEGSEPFEVKIEKVDRIPFKIK